MPIAALGTALGYVTKANCISLLSALFRYVSIISMPYFQHILMLRIYPCKRAILMNWRVPRKCLQCGKEYLPYHKNIKSHSFCKVQCRIKYFRKKQKALK